ncbi:MAG: hypothetical protein KTR29_14190 [Rhodothermaceae bacterium]|nr:hypothetical protein [Rhodothermaceae bacterium]
MMSTTLFDLAFLSSRPCEGIYRKGLLAHKMVVQATWVDPSIATLQRDDKRGRNFPILRCLIIGILFALSSIPLHAQLISPGDLSTVHTNLEGVNNCTQCHQLGQVGISNDKCLSCHTPIASRLEEEKGYHATIADQNCGDCHKDHFGLDFDVLRFQPETFDHDLSGFDLVGAHTTIECRSCHQPEFITSADVRTFKSAHDALEKTWLGVSAQCSYCHSSDNIHGTQFVDQDCGTCHGESEWEGIPDFDHAATSFPLTGRHQAVSCEGCHTPYEDQPDIIHFADLPAQTCASCHTDVHQGALDPNCGTCHNTDGWDLFTADFPTEAFDHSLTGFDLVGRHAEVTCSSCHAKPAPQTTDIQITYASASLESTFPDPVSDQCISCHTDSFHGGVFEDAPGGATCNNCHTEQGWSPATYDLARHNEETSFALTGAHLVAPCFTCHQTENPPELVFHFEDQRCESCHTGANPHGDQFQQDNGQVSCATCHGTNSWSMDGTFDHADTRFALIGKHATASCDGCHPVNETSSGLAIQQFTDIPLDCASCHQQDAPHEQQFEGQTCDSCHDSQSFFIETFDHNTTRFSLDGAHEGVACGSCHGAEQNPQGIEFIRYKPLGMECQDCHGDLENNNPR